MKIIINTQFGGFSLSEKAVKHLNIQSPYPCNLDFGIDSANDYEYRAHPRLLILAKQIGLKNLAGDYATLKIVDIPDDVKWTIDQYDGREWVAEVHRRWS